MLIQLPYDHDHDGPPVKWEIMDRVYQRSTNVNVLQAVSRMAVTCTWSFVYLICPVQQSY